VIYAVDLGDLEQATAMGEAGMGERPRRRPIRTFVTIPENEVADLLAHFQTPENR
jgi:hypothetical protein